MNCTQHKRLFIAHLNLAVFIFPYDTILPIKSLRGIFSLECFLNLDPLPSIEVFKWRELGRDVDGFRIRLGEAGQGRRDDNGKLVFPDTELHTSPFQEIICGLRFHSVD
jgi:hypothetical protein